MTILAIDPGTTQSGYVLMDAETYRPLEHGKVDNTALAEKLRSRAWKHTFETVVIERVASYGMPVGREVFETCEIIGYFRALCEVYHGIQPKYVYRRDEKITICGSPKANDATIRHALIDRFAKHDFRTGKGTKKNPDFWHGFAQDEWAAAAVGICWLDMEKAKSAAADSSPI